MLGPRISNLPHSAVTRPQSRKSPFTPEYRKTRLERTLEWISWTSVWGEVVFSDEETSNLDGPDGSHSYDHDLRKEPRLYSKIQCAGGSLEVCGAIGRHGTSRSIFVKTIMRPKDLRLENNFRPQPLQKIGNDSVHQHHCASV